MEPIINSFERCSIGNFESSSISSNEDYQSCPYSSDMYRQPLQSFPSPFEIKKKSHLTPRSDVYQGSDYKHRLVESPSSLEDGFESFITVDQTLGDSSRNVGEDSLVSTELHNESLYPACASPSALATPPPRETSNYKDKLRHSSLNNISSSDYHSKIFLSSANSIQSTNAELNSDYLSRIKSKPSSQTRLSDMYVNRNSNPFVTNQNATNYVNSASLPYTKPWHKSVILDSCEPSGHQTHDQSHLTNPFLYHDEISYAPETAKYKSHITKEPNVNISRPRNLYHETGREISVSGPCKPQKYPEGLPQGGVPQNFNLVNSNAKTFHDERGNVISQTEFSVTPRIPRNKISSNVNKFSVPSYSELNHDLVEQYAFEDKNSHAVPEYLNRSSYRLPNYRESISRETPASLRFDHKHLSEFDSEVNTNQGHPLRMKTQPRVLPSCNFNSLHPGAGESVRQSLGDHSIVFSDYFRKYGKPNKSVLSKPLFPLPAHREGLFRDELPSRCFNSHASFLREHNSQISDRLSDFETSFSDHRQINAMYLNPVNQSGLLNNGKKYSGCAVEFVSWRTLYIDQVEASNMSPIVACDFLISQTEGKVKEYALSIADTYFGKSWELIREILNRIELRFAQPHQVADELSEKLSIFPGVKSDHSNLEEFILLLQTIESHKSHCVDLRDYDTREGAKRVRRKLPPKIQEEYGRAWASFERSYGIHPDLGFLICVLSDTQNRSTGSRYAAIPNQSKTEASNQSRAKFNDSKLVCFSSLEEGTVSQSQNKLPSTKSSQVSRDEMEQIDNVSFPKMDKTSNTNKNLSQCKEQCLIHHSSSHKLSECYVFRRMSRAERIETIKSNGLCFKCFGQHLVRDSKSTKQCQSCNRNHHTMLHDFDQTNAKVGCVAVCGDSHKSAYCAKTLLVDISLASDPEKVVRGYAMIDGQSNATLIDESSLSVFGREFPMTRVRSRYVTAKHNYSHEAYVLPELIVRGVGSNSAIIISGTLSYPTLVDSCSMAATPETAKRFSHSRRFAGQFPHRDHKSQTILLIGIDNVHAHTGKQLTWKAPFVFRTPLGLTMIGKVCDVDVDSEREAQVCRTEIRVGDLEEFPENPLVTREFSRPSSKNFDVFDVYPTDDKDALSQDDKVFLKVMTEGVELDEQTGKLVFPLPMTKTSGLPENKDAIFRRTSGTLRSLNKSGKLSDVLEIMGKDIREGHVSEAADSDLARGCDFYLPPFVVYHKKKLTPRIVFDAAARTDGVSLNDLLLQGPPLLNELRDVVLRFREKRVAVTGDIKGMFLNFLVDKEHRRFLKFFWYKDNNPTKPLTTYIINTHAFGLKSSPAVANLAMQIISANCNSPDAIREDVQRTLRSDFYVDDLLTSADFVEQARVLIDGVARTLGSFGIKIHKFASSDVGVLEDVHHEDLADGMKDLPPEHGDQRALGIRWNVISDTLSLSSDLPKREFTKRGVLSVVCSLYDPFGFIAPVVLGGRLFQREIFAKKEATSTASSLDWDDPLPRNLLHKWKNWCQSLSDLNQIAIPRCLYPTNIEPCEHHLYVFSDASADALCYVMYLVTVDSRGNRHVGFISGGTRVAPRSCTTIPRMELNAALIAVRAADSVLKAFTLPISECKYFTDSQVVLGYLNNKSKRFSGYVERRVSAILELTSSQGWRYVETLLNPADIGTRPVTPLQLVSSIWFIGPPFLQQTDYPLADFKTVALPEQIHDKIVSCSNIDSSKDLLHIVLQRTNSFIKLLGITSVLLSLKGTLDSARQRLGVTLAPRSSKVTNEQSQIELLLAVQKKYFAHELISLNRQEPVRRNSPLFAFSPFLDENGIIRMGGRLEASELPWRATFPILLPDDPLTTVILKHFHKRCHHQGSSVTRHAMALGVFHIVRGSRILKTFLHRCVICQKLRGNVQNQQMSTLLKERVTPSSPFTNVGVDSFGPFSVKSRAGTRKHASDVKIWGCVFTCLSTRAVHLEALESLDTSSFLNAFTRFCAIRGFPQSLRSDRGTNFIGASKKVKGIDPDIVSQKLRVRNVEWKFNPPHSSHFGGVWERKIGASRRVLEGILTTLQRKTLDRESFVTFLAEVSRVVNDTPLWVTSWDSNDPAPLCPNDILMLRDASGAEDYESYTERDLLAHGPRRYRRAKYLTQLFWQR